MSGNRCPGQDMRYWKPEDIFEAPCPFCGTPIEFWKDEPVRVCPGCGREARNPRIVPGCAAHCPHHAECAPGDRVSQLEEAHRKSRSGP